MKMFTRKFLAKAARSAILLGLVPFAGSNALAAGSVTNSVSTAVRAWKKPAVPINSTNLNMGSSTQPVAGVCGTANGGSTYSSQPSAPPTNTLCEIGTATAVTGGGASGWSWQCTGFNNGSTANCSATGPTGTCGSAAGTNSASAPSSNLCSPGSASTVTSSGTTWSWTCAGLNGGGGPASCSANVSVNGQCGATAGSCTQGTATSQATSGNTTTWQCVGQNGGTTASCTYTASSSGSGSGSGSTSGSTVGGSGSSSGSGSGGGSPPAPGCPVTPACTGSGTVLPTGAQCINGGFVGSDGETAYAKDCAFCCGGSGSYFDSGQTVPFSCHDCTATTQTCTCDGPETCDPWSGSCVCNTTQTCTTGCIDYGPYNGCNPATDSKCSCDATYGTCCGASTGAVGGIHELGNVQDDFNYPNGYDCITSGGAYGSGYEGTCLLPVSSWAVTSSNGTCSWWNYDSNSNSCNGAWPAQVSYQQSCVNYSNSVGQHPSSYNGYPDCTPIMNINPNDGVPYGTPMIKCVNSGGECTDTVGCCAGLTCIGPTGGIGGGPGICQ